METNTVTDVTLFTPKLFVVLFAVWSTPGGGAGGTGVPIVGGAMCSALGVL